jgi:hypothetical protein
MKFITKTHEVARNSTRVRAQIPLRLHGQDAGNQFSEECHTVVVNMEGCGVRLSRPLQAGSAVLLDQLPCGMQVKAKVANCVPLGAGARFWLVGLALEVAGNIWCIQPAPADWGIDSKPPTASVVALPGKPNEWPYSVYSSRGEAHPGRK